ncbi:MAG: hypothetical protein NUV69_04875 [Candidatus Curtissbacteria bacterium]|nr:hypothetical protein [Candidatus Curtissbacteria bacterium]
MRDNSYNLLKTFYLEKTADSEFVTAFKVPQEEGYYALEANLKSETSQVKAITTIKVGRTETMDTTFDIDIDTNDGEDISGYESMGHQTKYFSIQ